MKLNEVRDDSQQNPENLEIGYKPVKKSETRRREKVTLGHLNKLRAIRELKAQQQAEERKHYSEIYGRTAG